jgi:hypothetical protein
MAMKKMHTISRQMFWPQNRLAEKQQGLDEKCPAILCFVQYVDRSTKIFVQLFRYWLRLSNSKQYFKKV